MFLVVAEVKSLANPITRGMYLAVNSPYPGVLVDETGHSIQERSKTDKMSNLRGASSC